MDLSISEAKIKRKSIKAAATRLGTYVNSAQVEHATKYELVERKRKLMDLFVQYDEVQSRVEYLESQGEEASEDVIAPAYIEDRARFEEAYYRVIALYDEHLSQCDRNQADTVAGNNSVGSHRGHNSESQVRLPKIKLPCFSGAYEDWYTFYDSFDKLIHTNDSLSAI